MIAYNPKSWIRLILSLHKSDTVRMLWPALITMAVLITVLIYLQRNVWCWDYEGTIAVHSLLGFVISLMLVFRTNTAYDRWWDGRKFWGGFVNHSRSFSIKLAAFVPREETHRIEALLINYFFACKDHLRKEMSTKGWMEIPGTPLSKYTDASHIPNALLADIMKELTGMNKRGLLTDIQLLMLNDEIRSKAENYGACERIRNTPIPYSYSMFIKKMIFFYSFTIPFAIMTEYGYWTILITCFIFYAFASLELLAEEIEDPFGKEANDLPTDDIAVKIKANVKEIFEYE